MTSNVFKANLGSADVGITQTFYQSIEMALNCTFFFFFVPQELTRPKQQSLSREPELRRTASLKTIFVREMLQRTPASLGSQPFILYSPLKMVFRFKEDSLRALYMFSQEPFQHYYKVV